MFTFYGLHNIYDQTSATESDFIDCYSLPHIIIIMLIRTVFSDNLWFVLIM